MIAHCQKCGFAQKTRQDHGAAIHRKCPTGGMCEFRLVCEGAGDVLAKVLGVVGVTKARVAKMLGRPCGCAERQRKMNEKLPL